MDKFNINDVITQKGRYGYCTVVSVDNINKQLVVEDFYEREWELSFSDVGFHYIRW